MIKLKSNGQIVNTIYEKSEVDANVTELNSDLVDLENCKLSLEFYNAKCKYITPNGAWGTVSSQYPNFTYSKPIHLIAGSVLHVKNNCHSSQAVPICGFFASGENVESQSAHNVLVWTSDEEFTVEVPEGYEWIVFNNPVTNVGVQLELPTVTLGKNFLINKISDVNKKVSILDDEFSALDERTDDLEGALTSEINHKNSTKINTKATSSTFNGWAMPVSKTWLGSGTIKSVKFNITTNVAGNGTVSILKSDMSTVSSKQITFNGTTGQDISVDFNISVTDEIFYVAIETDKTSGTILMASNGYGGMDSELLGKISSCNVYYKYGSVGWSNMGKANSNNWCSIYYEITTVGKAEFRKVDDSYSKEEIDSMLVSDVSLNIGSHLYAVVGDTIQLFKNNIIDFYNENVICKIECSKGKNYPRYWEYTPAQSDVGSTTMKISLLNNSGNTVDTKTITLHTISPTNKEINVLNVGDSTMYGGEIPIELSRRVKGTTGIATTPNPLSLSNINVVGRLKNSDNTVGWEGTGGWTYSNYLSAGNHAVRFQVANAGNISLGDLIRVSANNSKGYYQFQVVEINVTDGSGNIRAMFHTTAWASTFSNEVSSSGNITNTNGTQVGSYTSYSEEYFQPFWNNDTNSFDINTYVNNYCSGKCDYVYILLGINSLFSKDPFDSVNDIFNSCKNLLSAIHGQLPNTKILLSTNHLVSQNGGMGANYNCSTKFGQYDVKAINHLIFEMNKLYYTLENDTNFNSYVKVINTHAQFDSEHGFPSTEKNINTRSTTKETIGTNGVHPSNNGYWQIADAVFRAILGID